jgi:uncharacterized membrane protein
MKNYSHNSGKYSQAIFLVIFVFSAFFYTFNLGFSDLWSDEVYTKSIIAGPLSDFFARFRSDLHPPLYYMGLKLFTYVFGLSALSLRMFSVAGVLSTLLLGYFAGQRILGKKGALIFCLMIISIPMLASYSHEARMYTWAAFSVTGVFIYSCLFIKTGKKRDLAVLFIFTVVAMYIHYYSMLAAFLANAFVLVYLLRNRNRNWCYHFLSVLAAKNYFFLF